MTGEGASSARIAGSAELEAFIRFQWPLVRPLLEYLLELQLRRFEESSGVEVGPARPVLLDGEALDPLIQRLKGYMIGFDATPWTAQRLAELLLEPGKQYKQLHKLALALEKLLLVSSGLPAAQEPPPPPLLSALRPVNENPPKAAGAAGSGAKRTREDEGTGMGLVSATLGIRTALTPDGAVATMVANGDGRGPDNADGASGGPDGPEDAKRPRTVEGSDGPGAEQRQESSGAEGGQEGQQQEQQQQREQQEQQQPEGEGGEQLVPEQPGAEGQEQSQQREERAAAAEQQQDAQLRPQQQAGADG
ncbi:hypothetical protein MNEG_14036 [Monoraphidium neglectum]|uniref:Uncharacterized protein n=1 Tax=Monoraphidium neglectum TaxID=145388 RepID=A0A0D2MFP5_9CHLO|nr:hypothetical protein MNEG_14036 [Monoraphidium neglectum]KIY93925.1 hypothetical protein MNEG_14036 [Monoraphidium neglectum]|eukprot:XP_013892945.1 hypothetical protein MNEG_14036 [Monoraphidium neglectum]